MVDVVSLRSLYERSIAARREYERAVMEAVDAGRSLRDVAAEVGVSHGAIQQLVARLRRQ